MNLFILTLDTWTLDFQTVNTLTEIDSTGKGYCYVYFASMKLIFKNCVNAISGLTRHTVSNLGSLMSYVEEGIKARKTASTLQNPNSSRSHALLTVSLSSLSQNGHSATTFTKEKDFHRGSKLHLVDLAGSESAATCSGIHRLKVSHQTINIFLTY